MAYMETDDDVKEGVLAMQDAACRFMAAAYRLSSDDPFAVALIATAKSLRKRADKIIPPDDEFEKLGNVVPFERQKA